MPRIPVRVLQEPHVDHHVGVRAAPRACRRTTAASPRARRAGSSSPNCRAISARSSCGVIARVSISTSARSRSGASSASSRSIPTSGGLVRAQRMAAAGLAVALQQRGRVAVEIDQHRRARPRPPRPPPAPASIRSTEKSRLRGSMPITTGRSIGAAGEEPRQEADRQVVDRLEAEVLQRADRRRPAATRRAAHDHDVPLLGASCLGHLVPRATPCLSRKGAAVLHAKRSTPGQDLGDRGRKSTRIATPKYVIVTGCGIRAAGGRSRSTASASHGLRDRRQPQQPEPARLDQPVRAPAERARSAPRRAATSVHPVVGDQRRAAPQQPPAPAPTCPIPTRRGSAARARRRRPPSHADDRMPRARLRPDRTRVFAPGRNAKTIEQPIPTLWRASGELSPT